MDEKRKGEIALKLVGYYLRKRGVHLSSETKRELPNVAKDSGVPVEELKRFLRPLFDEMADEIFDRNFS